MITCSVCGGLNNPNNAVCEHCGSDLIDESEAIEFYDNTDNIEISDSSNDDSTDSQYIDDYDEYEDDY